MFDSERFVEDCRQAAEEGPRAIRELVAAAVADPRGVLSALGEPEAAGVQKLYCGPDVTVVNVIWAPFMSVMPHNHEMWAVIGVYGGAEDNIFWRRTEDGKVEAAGARALREREVLPLGPEVVHSVMNPVDKLTGAIHVYGGDFYETARKEWDSQALTPHDHSMERTLAVFEEANRRYQLSRLEA
ncbi:MAG: hypothetical protein P8X75_04705 [Limibacillus sp.]|jgi:predicted metal-dependent enzyme (double-stranded beta helix superfamily)